MVLLKSFTLSKVTVHKLATSEDVKVVANFKIMEAKQTKLNRRMSRAAPKEAIKHVKKGKIISLFCHQKKQSAFFA